jgi:hypothetical protein
VSGRIVSRRSAAAGGIVALLLTATGAGTAQAEQLDGELLTLCREFEANDVEFDRLCDDEADGHDVHQQIRASVDRCHEMRGLISDIPARTPEGLRAKAQVALIEFGVDDDAVDNSKWIARSLARDVLGRAGE